MARTLSTNVEYGRLGDSKPVWLIQVESSESTHYWATADTASISYWSGQDFTADRLRRDGIGSITQKIDLRKGGNAATLGDFKFKLINGDAYAQDTLFAPTIEYFENRSVELRLIFKETYLLYSGALGAFEVGEHIEGGTSGATADIERIITLTGTTGVLILSGITDPFDDSTPDEITGASSGSTADVDDYDGGVPSWANGVTLFDGTVTHVGDWDWNSVTFFCRASWKTPHKKIPTMKMVKTESYFTSIPESMKNQFIGLLYGDFQVESFLKEGLGNAFYWAHMGYTKPKLLCPLLPNRNMRIALAEHQVKERYENAVLGYIYDSDFGGYVVVKMQTGATPYYRGYEGYDINKIAGGDNLLFYCAVPSYDKDTSNDSDIDNPQYATDEDITNYAEITADAKSIVFVFPARELSEAMDYSYMHFLVDTSGDETYEYTIACADEANITANGIAGSASVVRVAMGWTAGEAFTKPVTLTIKSELVGGAYSDIKVYSVTMSCQRARVENDDVLPVVQNAKGRFYNNWIESASHSAGEVDGDLIQMPPHILESILCDELLLTTDSIGMAADFDGTDDYLNVKHSSALACTSTNLTIVCWIYLDAGSYGNFMAIWNKGDNAAGITPTGKANPIEYLIDDSGNQFFARKRSGAADEDSDTSTNVVGLGAWVHVAVVYNGGATDSVSFYKNGAADGGGALANADGRTDTEGDIFIGLASSERHATDKYFDGKIDELQIYNRALSGAEILADYNSGDGVYHKAGENGLIAVWHFDEGFGRDFRDSGGGRYHAGEIGAASDKVPAFIAGKVLTSSKISETNFDVIDGIRNTWKFARHFDKSTDSFKVCQEIAYEGAFAYVPSWDGKHSVRRITKQAAALPVLDNSDYLKDSLKISHQHVKEMRNEFVLYYAENYATNEFDRMLFVTNPAADAYDEKFTNLASEQETYWNLCRGAWENFRQVNRWKHKSKWIRDSATAELFLKLIIKMLTPRKYICPMSSPLKNIDFELCDQAELSDALLPDAIDDTEPFICSGLRINPADDTIDFEWTQIIDES